jgi:hypothetical protein
MAAELSIGGIPPWASGPGEILLHAYELLQRDSDRNRRLAMLSVDNSVELMLKAYLHLPRRATSLEVPLQERKEADRSFPALLDVMEKYARAKLTGLSLSEIEWYHGLRNQLYHDGNGLTVEKSKVETYAALAKVLFANLFGYDLKPDGQGLSALSGLALSPRQEIAPDGATDQGLPASSIASLIEGAAEIDRTLDELAKDAHANQAPREEDKLVALVRDGVIPENLGHDVHRLVTESIAPSDIDRGAIQAWQIAGDLQDLVAAAGGDRGDAQWSLLRRRATPELFRLVHTIWDRIHTAVKTEGLSWAPRLHVRYGYFSFQLAAKRANVISCVFRTRLNRVELGIRLPAPPEQLGLGRLFSNPQRWDEEHSQILILVDEQLGIPDIGRAVSIAHQFNE